MNCELGGYCAEIGPHPVHCVSVASEGSAAWGSPCVRAFGHEGDVHVYGTPHGAVAPDAPTGNPTGTVCGACGDGFVWVRYCEAPRMPDGGCPRRCSTHGHAGAGTRPQTLPELLAFIVAHYDDLVVRADVDGRRGAHPLASMSSRQALEHVLRLIVGWIDGRTPVPRIGPGDRARTALWQAFTKAAIGLRDSEAPPAPPPEEKPDGGSS